MNRKLLYLFITSFFALNGCLYSCNFAPKMKSFKNLDPCDSSGESTFVSFDDVKGESGIVTISAILSLPCDGGNEKTFSLSFYNADDLKQPDDLTHANYSWVKPPFDMAGASCSDPSKNQKVIDKYMNPNGNQTDSQRNLNLLSGGASITMGVGAKHPNRIYPYIIKIPYTNPNSIGKPNMGNEEGACAQGVDMSPFIQDINTLSPILQKGKPVSMERGEVILALYSYRLVQITAPFYSYGTKIFPTGSEEGLKSTSGRTSRGSYFSFQVRLKPGRYYIAWCEVPNPILATGGNFSLSHVNIYSKDAPDSKADYVNDCNKNIACPGKATAVSIS